MTLRKARAHVIAATLVGLASLHCGGGGSSASTTDQAKATQAAKPAATAGPAITLVEVEITQLRPSSDLIVELVDGQARLVTPNHAGRMLDFGLRSPDNPHLRPELLTEAKERFADALSKSERAEVRIRLDAGALASDLVDLMFTMNQVGAMGYELEIATSEGPRVLPLNLPQQCYGDPTSQCLTVHLRATEHGTLVSSTVTSRSSACDLAPDSEELAAISGRAITPADGSCPGWPHVGPGDEGLAQVLATLDELGGLCRISEVSVEDKVAAATFIPMIAALRAANQHVVFKAGGRATCADSISVSALIEATNEG